jgi:hypothetical protein
MVFLVLLMVLWRTKKVQSPYFASFWVEGIPIVWLAIVLSIRSL